MADCVFPAEAIAGRVVELAREIRARLDGPITLLGVLRGAAVFSIDLARALGAPLELTFVQARSYGEGTVSSGRVELGEWEEGVLRGRRVLVVDTVLDSGRTIAEVRRRLFELPAASAHCCVLLEKSVPRAVPVVPDFVGFRAPDRFLVGYGLDHGGRYRALPYVGAI